MWLAGPCRASKPSRSGDEYGRRYGREGLVAVAAIVFWAWFVSAIVVGHIVGVLL